jgi:hypothetical protein
MTWVSRYPGGDDYDGSNMAITSSGTKAGICPAQTNVYTMPSNTIYTEISLARALGMALGYKIWLEGALYHRRGALGFTHCFSFSVRGKEYCSLSVA